MQIDAQDIVALLELAGRAPKTVAEQAWYRAFLVRWQQVQQMLAQPVPPAAQEEETNGG